MHTSLGSFLHLAPLPNSFLPPPSVPGRYCSAPSLILLKKKHKHNKEDKVFLPVELRIAIQRDS
jgi:hypothetical protein